jgi:hypothetical protein
VKFKLDENLPRRPPPPSPVRAMMSIPFPAKVSLALPTRMSVSAATGAGRILVSLDVGLGDIRAYPPGSHAGIVVLRVPDQSAATVTKTISDLASLTELASLAGSVAVLQRGLLRIRHP